MCVCVCVSDRNSGALNGLTSSENAAPADAKNLRVKVRSIFVLSFGIFIKKKL